VAPSDRERERGQRKAGKKRREERRGEEKRREEERREEKEKSGMGVNERYTQWKTLVPVLYDWLANHNLVWPSLSCRSLSPFSFFRVWTLFYFFFIHAT
jgi:histone-binding protein RBBP4